MKIRKTEFVGFRATEQQRRKLETLARLEEVSMSRTLCLLIDKAHPHAQVQLSSGSQQEKREAAHATA